MSPWLSDFADALVWAVALSVTWFVIQYTLSSLWWRDPVGRTIVGKDIALLVLFIPSCILLVWPHAFTPLQSEIIGIVSLAAIVLFMVWRCVVWWRIRQPGLPYWRDPARRRLRRHEAD